MVGTMMPSTLTGRPWRARAAGPGLEQPLAAGPGQVDDLLAVAAAVGGVGLVGQIDEVPLRKAAGQFAVDRQPAHAGVENANRHGARFRRGTGRRPPPKIAAGSGDSQTPEGIGSPDPKVRHARSFTRTDDIF